MTLAILLITTAIVFLLFISAFFSGAETALTAASRARMYALEKDGNKKASLVNRLTLEQERLIGTILLGNNLTNILASVLATSLFLHLFGQTGVVYATFTMTALVVVFAEVLPKTYAILNPDRTALAVAPVLRVMVALLAPIASTIQLLVSSILGLWATKPGDDDSSVSVHDELKGVIDLHHQEGGVVKHDRDMLDGILDLRNLVVSDVMVHRTRIQAINVDDEAAKILNDVIESPFTRLPLWKDESENIIGVLHAKDMLREVSRIKGKLEDLNVRALSTPPWFVPDTTSLKDQLNAFLKRNAHFALVVDEYGEAMGLVTLEDILEEIVGEISDEHDVVVAGVRPQPDGTVNVDGSVPIRDLNRFMEWDLPDEEATTIAGLVIHEAQAIPEPGQAFTFYGFRFEVTRRQRNKLTSLRIIPIETQKKASSTSS